MAHREATYACPQATEGHYWTEQWDGHFRPHAHAADASYAQLVTVYRLSQHPRARAGPQHHQSPLSARSRWPLLSTKGHSSHEHPSTHSLETVVPSEPTTLLLLATGGAHGISQKVVCDYPFCKAVASDAAPQPTELCGHWCCRRPSSPLQS